MWETYWCHTYVVSHAYFAHEPQLLHHTLLQKLSFRHFSSNCQVDCLWQNTHTHTGNLSTHYLSIFIHSLIHLFIGISSIRGLEQQPLCIPLCAPQLKEKKRNCNVFICIELCFYLLLLMLLLENWPINHGGADFSCLLHCELVSAKWSVSFRLKNCASLFEVSKRDLFSFLCTESL